jgi:hypothetical protein
LRDRSKRPHYSPNATSDEIIGKVVHLRQHYHFGPLKISMYLKRYHDVEISQSGVWQILKRLPRQLHSAHGARAIGGFALCASRSDNVIDPVSMGSTSSYIRGSTGVRGQ